VPALFETEEDEVEDEGQEKTLVLGGEDVVREANGCDKDIPGLPPLVTEDREDVVTDTDVAERTV
jgi:hypothetical protein